MRKKRNFDELRRWMVEVQLRSRGIKDKRVLDAFLRVPRHEFVWPVDAPSAYGDHPMPIGHGQTISQPYMVALMTEKLDLRGDEKVLEIGTGSGYQAAILSLLAREVWTVERIPELHERAKETLERLGFDNVHAVLGDGTLGLPSEAPFDGIIVTAAAPAVPEELVEQLAPGGVAVVPVGDRMLQRLTILRKDEDGRIETEEDVPCVFVPLIGRKGWR